MMVAPSFLLNPIAVGLAAAASFAVAFFQMDANPSLFFYDKCICTDRRLSNYFRGKRIWITGASAGIGAELAIQLVYHGASVVLSGRNRDRLIDVSEQCQVSTKHRCRDTDAIATAVSILPFDVNCNDDLLAKTVQTAIDMLGGSIDILILNAGQSQLSLATDTTATTTRQLLEVNCVAPVRLALSVLKHNLWSESMHRGHIVVLSSVAAKMAVPLSSSYAASKHAVHGYFSSLRSEHSPWLRVDLPCPGPVNTNIMESAYTTKERQQSSSATENKMAVDRCARLILSGMVGPSFLFHETWIQQQPLLTLSYVQQYFPGLATLLLGKAGSLRRIMWEFDLPLYNKSSWSKAAAIWKEKQKA